MEQIRLDPVSPFYVKREIREGSAVGDLFASMLDGKLKSSGATPANDQAFGLAKLDPANPRDHRLAYSPPRRVHQTLATDRDADERDSFRLKAKQIAEMRIAHHEKMSIKDPDDKKSPNEPEMDSAVAPCAANQSHGPSDVDAATSTPQTSGESHNADGQNTGDAANEQSQAHVGESEQVEDETLTAMATAAIATGQTHQANDAAVPGIAAPNTVSSDEAVAMAQAAVAAAATVLPEGSIGTNGAPIELQKQPELAASATVGTESKITAGAVTGNAAPTELIAIGADQAVAVGKTTAKESQSAGAVFRQSSGGAKAKPQSSGQGAADARGQSHQAGQAAAQKSVTGSPSPVDGAAAGGTVRGALSSIDGEFGAQDQSGAAGWTLHLAQGAAGKRADFIANLRQHLQNLPAHEQVAVHVQRAVADRLGKLTVELSPVELGRIQVKLKIDEENRVAATITVERPGTLELLQRDSRALERALQDAGLKTDSGSLSFTLQGGETGDFDQDRGLGGTGGTTNSGAAADAVTETAMAARAAVIETADGLVDVEV